MKRPTLSEKRLIISAMALSFPGTMGGNSKITIEIIRHLHTTYDIHVLVPDAKLKTIEENLGECLKEITIHVVRQFNGNEKFAVIGASLHYCREIKPILEKINAGPNDWYFGCSDFHADAIPGYLFQQRFGFKWLPSAFLFVPFIVENLTKGYKFPPLLYLAAWAYAKLYIFFASRRATAFVITNKSDFRHFPHQFANDNRLFDYYGGVNLDQIPKERCAKTRDVIFCSRLHPQKGIDAFLDTWAIVYAAIPTARLTVIGNGDKDYESYLKAKAVRLGIADAINWLGYVNNEAKFTLYAESRVFVHPTIFDNNGMVAAEALCSGLPVVMYDLPALRDVYSIGCIKVPFGDKRAFADAVIALLTNNDRYHEVAPTPKQIAELRTHWDWATRAREFNAFLDQL